MDQQDMRRVEDKLNRAMLEKQALVSGKHGSLNKRRENGLYAFLEEQEGKESTVVSRDSLASRDFQEANRMAMAKEAEYMSGLSQAKAKIGALELELSATRQDLDGLRTVLEEERRAYKGREHDLVARLNLREQEFSNEIQGGLARQQETISKLVDDKQTLSDQVASLASQLRLCDQKNAKVVHELREKYKAEIKEAQAVWTKAEKDKRDKWMKTKEKEIKELTIKGLEPEVERMLAKQREEKMRLETENADLLRREKVRLESEYQTRLEEFRERVLGENENALKREKEFLQGHFEGLAKEASAAALRRQEEVETKMRLEIEEEREKRKRENAYWEDRLTQVQREGLEKAQRLKAEFEEERREWRGRIEEERTRVRGSMGEEEKTVRKRVEDEMRKVYELKAEQAKAQAIQERDEQIQMIVERLLKEKAQEVEQAIQDERARVRQKKAQTENVLDDLRTELTVYKERLLEEKGASNKLADEVMAKQRTVDNLLKENEDLRQQLLRQKHRVKGLEDDAEKDRVTIRAMEKSFGDQLELEKRKALEGRQELHELIVQHKAEKELIINDMEERQATEVETLERRVKLLIDKKDREINEIRLHLQEKDELCLKYEQLLARQRADLLGGVR